MDEEVKRIDPHFAYEWHEIEDDIMRVYVSSTKKEAQCPYCGSISKQVHSVYPRKFRDVGLLVASSIIWGKTDVVGKEINPLLCQVG